MKPSKPQFRRYRSLDLVWPRVVLRKWLNLNSKDSDYDADSDGNDFDGEDDIDTFVDANEDLPRLRRRNSETFRAQYINTKDIRICVGSWNVGGKPPDDDIEIGEWLCLDEPADIYVLGLQEVVPLNAGNIFGVEDNRPILKWENIIRDTLSRVNCAKDFKSYSDPPSPSRYKPSHDVFNLEDEVLLGSDCDDDEEFHPVYEVPGFYEVMDETLCGPVIPESGEVSSDDDIECPYIHGDKKLRKQISTKRLEKLRSFQSSFLDANDGINAKHIAAKLNKTLSKTEKIGLSWPEPPLDLIAQRVFKRSYSLKSKKPLKAPDSFTAFDPSMVTGDLMAFSEANTFAQLDLKLLLKRRKKSEYVRIVSKQMVGIFLTIWVRRHMRKHIQNLKVSTVGVGVMGYIGNKGSVSVSMSIYQTLFCFVCTHLTSGEKEGDQHKRNANVHEIHRRTVFHADPGLRVPRSIYDHERIIWFGDLNYRINLPYEDIQELILEKEWSKLVQKDQLLQEQKRGHVFEGWREGMLDFPPTYKYELNSDLYCGGDPKIGRRNPAWCDRILSFGDGIQLLNYGRSEIKMSDHRPVTAIYDVQVEVFSPKKLQRALAFTNAEIENEEILMNK